MIFFSVIGCGPIEVPKSTFQLGKEAEGLIDAKVASAPKKKAPPKKPTTSNQSVNLTSVCTDIGRAISQLTPYKRNIFPTDNDLKNAFISAHNKIRTMYKLPNLVWDPQIAAYAQAWANYLKNNNQCNMQHRSNLGKQEGKNYGENLAWNMVSPSFGFKEYIGSPEIAALNWSNECKDYSYGTNSCKAGKQCGHFTQVVWKASQKFGCGVAVCSTGNSQSEIWVCNYDPAGNMTVITNGKADKLKPF